MKILILSLLGGCLWQNISAARFPLAVRSRASATLREALFEEGYEWDEQSQQKP